MPIKGLGQENEPPMEAEAARESFLTVLRFPVPTPDGVEVQGAVVLQRSGTTVIELDGATLTFDSVELRAAIEPLSGTQEGRAAA